MNRTGLKTAYRDIRVTGKTFRLPRRAQFHPNINEFVRALLRRYHHGRGVWPQLGLAWPHLQVGATTSRVHYHSLHFAPRLAFTMLRWQQPVMTVRAQPAAQLETRGRTAVQSRITNMIPAQAQPPLSIEIVPLAHPQPTLQLVSQGRPVAQRADAQPLRLQLPQPRNAHLERLAMQLIERRERVEPVAPARGFRPGPNHSLAAVRSVDEADRRSSQGTASELPATVKPLPSSGPVVSPVPRIVHRAAVVTPNAGQSSPERIGSMAEQSGRPGQSGHSVEPKPPSTHLNAINLSHLTDQIIQTIDGRIIAHQERMGRM